MPTSKINNLIFPLLFAILFSIASKLSLGHTIDLVFYTVFTPIRQPIGVLHQTLDKQTAFIKNLPQIQSENRSLRSQNAKLLTENELLKQSITDSQNPNLKSSFKSVLPVRITGSIGNHTVTSSFPIDKVRVGQPLVSDTILLGIVSEIKGSVINIRPLDDDRSGVLSVHTSSGQKGFYKYAASTAQVTDIPSLSPVNPNDYVFTETTEQIPGNLVIGKIIKVISNPQEPLQKAEIKLSTTFSDNPDNLAIILDP
ncbi:MAG TPA: rod shape-determining protein MreC [Candidatus Woesebacteria bacterium]|nr:rod shape-determining protein MreC [Candidatus Woesebacteria bacterium]